MASAKAHDIGSAAKVPSCNGRKTLIDKTLIDTSIARLLSGYMSNSSKNRGGPPRKPGAGSYRAAGRGSERAEAPRKFSGKSRSGKPFPDKPFAGKPFAGKPRTGKPEAGEPRACKAHAGKSYEGKPYEGKPYEGKPRSGKAFPDKSFAGKPFAGKPRSGKPDAGEPRVGRSPAGKPYEGRPHAGKSFSDKSFSDKSFSGKSFSGRSSSDRSASGKSFPNKSHSARPHSAASRPIENRSPAANGDNDERIAKVIARAGLCSRRDAEAWIAAGRVEVNGIRLRSPALNVGASDSILVDGRPLAERERTRLFLFHKPRGLVTTDRDPEDRPTIFSVLPDELPRVVTIGRLDINTEGLLLLTNDGGLARILELPSTGWVRRYRVRANGTTDQAALDSLSDGITIDGIHYAGIVATLDRVQGANVWLTMALREGKNREVKRVLEHLGLAVNRLIRISFGPFQLGELAERAVEEVKTRVLRDQLGMTLAQEAGVDFVGPVVAPIVTVEERERRRAARSDARSFGERNRPAPTRHSAGRDPGNDAPHRRGRTEPESAPRRDRPKPAVRKHVSTLRRERREAEEAEKATPRRRVERTETADRKGRTVTIERVVVPSKEGERSSRNSRRFAEEKGRGRDRRSSGPMPSPGKPGRDGHRNRPGGPRPSGGRPPRGRT
jgi:23S rRNA pseudouridine2605 synthase